MFKRFALFTAMALVFSTPAISAEISDTNDTEQDEALIAELNSRKKINDEINYQINNSSTQELNELVRNANALKRLNDPNYKDKTVDVKNKAELRAFMKDYMGMQENITPQEQLIKTPVAKTETPKNRQLRTRKAL